MLPLPKILALDLDGTLLRSDHKVSQRTIWALEALMEKGCIPVISTGRSYGGVLPVLEQLQLEIPAICFNGAAIRDGKGNLLKEWLVPEEPLRKVLDLARQRSIHFQGFHNEKVYAEKHGVETEFYQESTGLATELTDFDQWARLAMNKAILIGSYNRDNQQWPELHEAHDALQPLEDQINMVFSRPFYLELVDRNCSKGIALHWMMDHLAIKQEESAAMGDAMNDLEMLKAAHVSVAMENGDPRLFEYCSHRTGHCDEDGVAQFIENQYL